MSRSTTRSRTPGWSFRRSDRNEESAFAALYDETVAQSFAVAYATTGCPEAALRAVRTAYLEVWRTPASDRPDWISIRSWVLGAVHEAAKGERVAAA